jgi:hypothetical protein
MVAVLHDEICPISEQLLFSLYDAAKRGVPVPVTDVPKERRSSVVLFCYRRGHLEQAGLAVAATCDEDDLVEVGGSVAQFGRATGYAWRQVLPAVGGAHSTASILFSRYRWASIWPRSDYTPSPSRANAKVSPEGVHGHPNDLSRHRYQRSFVP